MPSATIAPFDPQARNYTRHPLHLFGTKVGHVLQADLDVEEVFNATGRVVIRRARTEGSGQVPASLFAALGPAVVGGYTWSGLWIDAIDSIDITALFTEALVLGDVCPYTGWRVRNLFYTGYASALYQNSPALTPEPVLNGDGFFGSGFTAVSGGFALSFAGSSGVQYGAHTGYRYIWNGGGIDRFFPSNYQVEVGYGDPDPRLTDWKILTGDIHWPAYSAEILTDEPQWRGYPQFYPYHP